MSELHATIIAPASALGGGVAVIRASGPLSESIYEALTDKKNPAPRQAQLVTLSHPVSKKTLDKAVALYFENPASFTGENVLELHVHGGRAVVDSVITAAIELNPSIRLAEPGEFTKRAYLNGKIDLTEAEAIADLVAAETEAQAEIALSQMGGALSELYEGWRASLVHVLAMMEASIDFVDEEDVPQSILDSTHDTMTQLITAMSQHLHDGNLGERLRDGFVVAVIGAPNAGKSSLVNVLAKRDVAIVTDIAGTTRDVLEVPLNLGGYPVIVMDTAGLRETKDTVEAIGIARAKERAAHADIVVALFDATTHSDPETLDQINSDTILVHTKIDMGAIHNPVPHAIGISTATGQNIDQLIAVLTERIQALVGTKNNAMPLLTRARHREAVVDAQEHLMRGLTNPHPELLAEDIRLATRALGRITGRVDVEDLLDVIFSSFCIGK
jgi:tRNA modification GTPase